MQSKIIERILNEDNKSLYEIIEIVKNNATFQDVMNDVKEEFFINDSIHGISHNERVVLLACYIGIQEGLNNEELRIVLETAKYHDIGRGFEGNHGQYSTILIDRNKEYIFPNLSDDEINIIKALCHGHSIDDKKYEEIAGLYKIENIKEFKKLLDVVKDADALDRVRLPRFGQLDETFLRTETAKKTVDISKELFRKYKDIQRNLTTDNRAEYSVESNYEINKGLRSQLLFDGENYYLVRSLNKVDIESFDNGNGIVPKIDNNDGHTVQDVMAQIRMQHRKTNLISMSEDPNIVLTYDKSNLHRFVLIRLSKDEIENPKKVFSAGEYLLGVMDYQIEMVAQNAPQNVKQILETVDNASSIEEIVKIINGADRQVQTSLIESKQQYLSEEEQLEQSKKIAKCKVLNYYGLMRDITKDEKGTNVDIRTFSKIMRNGYSSSEWLYSGKIEQERIIDAPPILIDSLALIKQAEFQGKDKEVLKKVEQDVLRLILSDAKINQDNYQLEYTAHNNFKSDLTIDKAFEITGGQISYRDTNMQMTAIRSLAEMTLNKRKIIELLQKRLPDINVEELLKDTYCVNQEMITRQNNRGSQISRNISFIISNYGYDFDDETSAQILQSVENLSNEQLNNIISKGVDAQEISNLLIETRENHERIQFNESKKLGSKYIAEAIVEGYNWKKDGNSLTRKEKTILSNTLLQGVKNNNELYNLYEAINKIQIGKSKFTQDKVFAIMINFAIDRKIGNTPYGELLKKDISEIQLILLENQEELQTSVLPISIDLLAGRGNEIKKLNQELINLGVDEEFIRLKDIKNVYEAKKIVDECDIGRDLTVLEKRSLIENLLKSSGLNKGNSRFLKYAEKNLELLNLNREQIVSLIIKASLGQLYINSKNVSLRDLTNNRDNIYEKIKDNASKGGDFKISDGEIAVAVNKTSMEHNEFYDEVLKSLNLEEDERLRLEGINSKNIVTAFNIVNNYNFSFDISEVEKKHLMMAILENKMLSGKKSSLISTIIQNLTTYKIDEQKIYAIIINLAVNEKIVSNQESYSYTKVISNEENVLQNLAQNIHQINCDVSETTVWRATCSTLSQNELEQMLTRLQCQNITKEFLDQKDERNIYVAERIVNEYEFTREISDKEKKALIYSILNRSMSPMALINLIDNMKNEGLSKQQIFGMIINLGVNGLATEETNFSYKYLLCNMKDCCHEITKHKIEFEVTDSTILKAEMQLVDEKGRVDLKEQLAELGIEEKFIDSKSFSNLYTAKYIAENCKLQRNLSDEEKSKIIKILLNISHVNEGRNKYLVEIMKRIENSGFSVEDVCGILVNSAVRKSIIPQKGYSYSDLFSNYSKSDIFLKYKDKIDTEVTEDTIMCAMKRKQERRKLTPEERQHIEEEKQKRQNDLRQKKLEKEESERKKKIEKEFQKHAEEEFKENIKKTKDELIPYGFEQEFLDERNDKNILTAKKIVDEYVFKRELDAKEKADIVYAILANSSLKAENGTLLDNLIKRLQEVGLGKNEIYGCIINLAINGSVVEDSKGYNYKSLLNNNHNACQTIIGHKEKIRTEITESTIITSKSKRCDAEEISRTLDSLQIDKNDVKNISNENLYVAIEIVENYNFGKKLSDQEKKALVLSILNSSKLEKNKKHYLTNFMNYMEKSGFDIQEVFGMVINLGVHGKITKEGGLSYSIFLSTTKNACKKILDNKYKVQTEVTEETIQKAVKKVNKPQKVKGQDIAKTTMELTIEGSGGSQLCEDLQSDYQRLIQRKIEQEKEGDEQDVPN